VTATPTASPIATGTAAPGSCQASWSVVNSWSGGFQLGFTVTNPGATAASGWNVSFSWPGTQAITQIWSASATQSGAAVSVTNASYDGSLTAGGATTFGLLGSGTAPASLGSVQCTAH
jgi:chitin-binding protein